MTEGQNKAVLAACVLWETEVREKPPTRSRVTEAVREPIPFELSSAMMINRANKMQHFMGFWQHEPSEGHKIIAKKEF